MKITYKVIFVLYCIISWFEINTLPNQYIGRNILTTFYNAFSHQVGCFVSPNSSNSNSHIIPFMTLQNISFEPNPIEIVISCYLLNFINKTSDVWCVIESKHLIILFELSCFCNMKYISYMKKMDLIARYIIAGQIHFLLSGCRGRDRMVVWFLTTYAISAYHQ